MTVASISASAYEFTESDDELRERVKVESFLATGGPSGGQIIVYTRIMTIASNGVVTPIDPAEHKELWRSDVLNANGQSESAINIEWCDGLRVEMPEGARLVVYTAVED